MKNKCFPLFVFISVVTSCKKEIVPPDMESLEGSYSVVNKDWVNHSGIDDSTMWVYDLKIEAHPTSADSLVLYNLVDIGLTNYVYTVTVHKTSSTTFTIPQQYLTTDTDWLATYQFSEGSGYLVHDSIYYNYHYINEQGTVFWGSGAGLKKQI